MLISVPVMLKPGASIPNRATEGSSGFDLRAHLDCPQVLPSLGRMIVPTGLSISLPEGYEAQVRPRSGLAAKRGITVINSPGTIDSDYRGEIGVILVNLSTDPFLVEPGERIAQLIFAKVEVPFLALSTVCGELLQTDRGAGGFGSTGTH